MKKTSVSIMYDDEKLNAIRLYMSQRDLDFKEKLEKSVDALYAKYVPANVREFIDMKDSQVKTPKPKKPKTTGRKYRGGNLKNQNFGIEIEMTGITRSTAAKVIAGYFHTDATHVGGCYDAYLSLTMTAGCGRLCVTQALDVKTVRDRMQALCTRLNLSPRFATMTI